ncbi:MAG: bifunctional diguanylate cyclase/phosphodiesterase [Actinomycetes bacterium]
MRRFSLMTTFAVVSLSTMAALMVALTFLFASTVRTQARQDGMARAETFTTVGVERVITNTTAAQFWADPAKAAQMASAGSLDGLATGANQQSLDSLNLYSRSGELLWTSTGDVVNGPAAEGETMDKVLATGRSVAAVENGSDGAVLSVYVPISYGDEYAGTYGVAEVNLPWADTQALIRNSTLTVAALIATVLLLAWLLMYRTVHRASTRLRQQSVDNERLALHDPLTGLPNRRLLADRLERAVAASTRGAEHVALMILDVDRFKEVNDTLGHDRGDALLIEVSERLATVLRDADTVARLGGDEFAVLAPRVQSVEDAERLARRVHAVFDEPFLLGDLVLHVESSLGVAVLPDHATDGTELMQRADIAMYAAKQAHLGVVVYNPVDDGSSTERLIMLGDLRSALGTGQLSVHYQPKVNLESGHVVGTEALLRWQHPTRGNIPPNDFIPLAERTGLIHGLTRYVLEMVVVQMGEWDTQETDFAHLPVAVNLSARNLVEPSFADFVEDLLASHNIEPERLELEVTESALIEDPVRSHAMLHRLAAMGVTIAVDDFGTGYTSMAQLEQMPLKTLKIDRSFVIRMVDDPGGATLVKAIVELAHEFGLEVVAEGVEDEVVTERLREMGCDVGQGYLWSRPVPSAELPTVLLALSFLRPVDDSAAVGARNL